MDVSLAPSERPRVRPVTATAKLLIAALALTASLFPLLYLYVGAYAQVARNEYHRQAAVTRLRDLEAENARLRCRIDAARAPVRIIAATAAQQLVLADPATGVDYILLPAGARPGQPQPAPPAPAWTVAQKQRTVAMLAALTSGPPTAQASTLYCLRQR